jgi:gamma-glutamylcyclotransferase
MLLYYFAFGSNMDMQQMNDRQAVFTKTQKGILKDWKLVFNKISRQLKDVGFANIVPENNSFVEGVIYEVNETTIDVLDRYEGSPQEYHKKIMPVETSNNKSVNCIVYIANHSKTNNSLKPKKNYLDHLLKGKEFLSENYFLDLKKFETID